MFALERMVAYPSHITPYLYLSGVECLDNYDFFIKNNVTHVLSILKNAPRVMDIDSTLKQLVIPIDDSSEVNIRCHFETAIRFINEAKLNNSSVLVHCEKGISRSASFVIAWLLKEQHEAHRLVNFSETLRDLVRARTLVGPNPGFVRQLQRYAAELNTLLELKQNELETARRRVVQSGNRNTVSSLFFNGSGVWEAKLSEDFPELTRDDRDFFISNQVATKDLYLVCQQTRASNIPKVSSALIVGFTGSYRLLAPLFNTYNSCERIINHLLIGALYGLQLRLLEQLHTEQFYRYRSQIVTTLPELLFHAATNNNVALMKFVTKNHPDFNWNISNRIGRPLLFAAVFSGSIDVFEYLLLHKGLSSNVKCTAGNNLLTMLAFSKNRQLIEYIRINLPHLNPQETNNSNLSAMTIAERRQNRDFLELYRDWKPSVAMSLNRNAAQGHYTFRM